MKLNAVAVACLVSASLCAVVLSAQQPPAQSPPTFRAEVNYVEVDAVVTDERGALVSGLTADDFELLEDKKTQKISTFSQINIPIEREERPLYSPTAIEPDVQVNTGRDGRVYLIVLDDLHTDPIRAPRVKAAMHQFIERNFGSNDVAAVTFTGGLNKEGQDFTNNRRLLLAAVDKFGGRKTQGITLARIDELKNTQLTRTQGDPLPDPLEFERAYFARAAVSRIRDLATFMASVRGRRKTMLLVGEGIEYNMFDIINNSQASGVLEEIRDAIAAATRGNVSIYAIDPRGLAVADADMIQVGGAPSLIDPTLQDLGSTSMAQEFRQSQDSLRIISDETGGFAVLNQNDYKSAFDRIVRENSNYYLLGYYPSNDRRDGRFRNITLRVKRPGLQVRARKGYVAARGKLKEAPGNRNTDPLNATVDDALSSPLAVPGIPIRVFAAPYKGIAPNASVALSVEITVNDFTFVPKGDTYNDKLEVSFSAIDTEGKFHAGNRHIVTMAMKADTLARAKAGGFRVLSEMDLPPGRYQLRVGAAEDGGKSGSVVADLEVPDFYKQPLTMSGLAVTAASARLVATARPKDPLAQLLPGPLTTAREFSRDDELALFTEFYENTGKAPPQSIDISTTVRAEDGRVIVQNREERQSSELQGGRGGFGFTASVPLKDLAPGLYVIHVEGRSRASSEPAGIGRDVQIRVRER